MSEFERVDLTGKVPEVICALCAKNATAHTPTGIIAVHCKHTERGGWRIRGEWTVTRQIRADAFEKRFRWTLGLAKLQLTYERDCLDTATVRRTR